MRGPEDGPEAARSAGAARGPGLPPVDDRHPEGLSSAGGKVVGRFGSWDRLDFTGAHLWNHVTEGLQPSGPPPSVLELVKQNNEENLIEMVNCLCL